MGAREVVLIDCIASIVVYFFHTGQYVDTTIVAMEVYWLFWLLDTLIQMQWA